MTKTIHFEGIAGSGKSTSSERLCEILKSKGVELLDSASVETEMIESRSWNDDFLENLTVRRGLC